MSAIKKKTRKSKLVDRDKSPKEIQYCQELEPSTSRTEDNDWHIKPKSYKDTVLLNCKTNVENLNDKKENANNEWYAESQIIVHNVKKEVISVEEAEDTEIDGYEEVYIKKEIKEEPIDSQEFYERIITTALNKYKEITKTDDELNNFKCLNCDKIFNSITKFQDHLEVMHGDETVNVVLEEIDGVYLLVAKPNEMDIYNCNCKLIFHSKEEYDVHTLKCKKCFQCDICNQSYPGKAPYDIHFLIYHRVSSFYEMPVELKKCRNCRKTYVGLESLHWCPLRKLFGYFCIYCKKEFQTSAFLCLHKKVMAEIQAKCNKCGLLMERECQLDHVCFKRNFECSLCFEVLYTDAELQEHILVTHIVNEACQEAVPKTPKKLKRKKSKDLKLNQKQSKVSETSEFQIKQEQLDMSETNGLQQKQLFQDSYNTYIDSVADYDKQRYNNLMKTLIKDEPVEQDDVEMHLNNHIIAVVSDDKTEESDTVSSVAQDTDRKVKKHRNKKESIIENNEYARIYKCGKCSFFGIHKEYTEHKNVCKYRNKKIYECKKCSSIFRSTSDFVCHYVREGWAPLQCFDCHEILDNRITYENHVFAHMFSIKCYTRGKVTFKCNLCKHTLRKPDYYKHWVKHLDLYNVKCETIKKIIKVMKERRSKRQMTLPEKLTDDEIKTMCNMLASSKKDLIKDKRKSCSYCKKVFSRVENAKVHMIEHLLTNAYLMKQHFKALICQFCLEPLQTADSFKQHMTTHAFLKRHHCELCSKTFSDSSNYSKHKKIHNVLVLICDLCSKKFASKKMLILHFAKDHAGNKKFVCRHCGKEFACISHYKKHVKVVHETVPRHMCRQCKKRFKCLKDKWNHMWLEHGERTVEADCPACDVKFRTYQKLKKHLQMYHEDLPQAKREKILQIVKASKRKIT